MKKTSKGKPYEKKTFDLDREILKNKGYKKDTVENIVDVMASPFSGNKEIDKVIGSTFNSQSEIKNLLDVWHKDFLFFVESAILAPYNRATGENFKVTRQQKEACIKLCKIVNDKINSKKENGDNILGLSIMAGKGTGKDAWVSWAILWFMTFPYPKIPCLSVSADQLNKVLWSEISKWLSCSLVKDWYTLRAEKLFFNGLPEGERGLQWLAFPKAVPKALDGSVSGIKALAGVHAKYLMEVVDEGSGIRDDVYEELETNLTGKVNLMLTVFNPSRRDGYAVRTQQDTSGRWVKLNWNAEDCEIVNQEKIQAIKDNVGVDSNIYRVNVLGLPPVQGGDCWFTYEMVMNAVEREVVVEPDDVGILSLDCGAGVDKAVLCHRKGYKVEWFQEIQTRNAVELCNWAGHWLDKTESEALYVDSIGIGWGVVAMLQDTKGSRVISVDVRNMATNTVKYYNKRAELFDSLYKAFENNLISIPNDEELIEELLALKLVPESTRMRVILKKEIRSEIGRSTNKADTLSFTMSKRMSSKFTNFRRLIDNSIANKDGLMSSVSTINHTWMSF